MFRGEGYEKLWAWFGLSRASFLVLPRSFMHQMPDDWQNKMADLLNEYDETFKDVDCVDEVYVSAKKGGMFAEIPNWIKNYRHPDIKKIESMKRGREDA